MDEIDENQDGGANGGEGGGGGGDDGAVASLLTDASVSGDVKLCMKVAPFTTKEITPGFIKSRVIDQNVPCIVSHDGSLSVLCGPSAKAICIFCSNFQNGIMHQCLLESELHEHWSEYHALDSHGIPGRLENGKTPVSRQTKQQLYDQVKTPDPDTSLQDPVSWKLNVLFLYCVLTLNQLCFY